MPTENSQTLRFLSIVIPIYNEEESIGALRTAMKQWLPSLGPVAYELVLVNDGSKDNSQALCAAWAAEDSYVKVISFSRNFGHQSAVSAGLRYASGEAVVIIDADLQDPLEVIHEMIQRYEEGYDIAYGKRISREGESAFKLCSAWIFYRFMRKCIHKDMPVDTGDFRLVSRRCVDIINSMPESHRFLRGMFAWVGFRQIAVPYQRDKRMYGKTKYPLRKMIIFAWNAITSFSTIPIHVVTIVGFIFACIGFITCLYALVQFFGGDTVRGWTSLLGLFSMMGGVLLIAVGIIGEYVGKIYDEVKQRPLYIVAQTINMGNDTQTLQSKNE